MAKRKVEEENLNGVWFGRGIIVGGALVGAIVFLLMANYFSGQLEESRSWIVVSDTISVAEECYGAVKLKFSEPIDYLFHIEENYGSVLVEYGAVENTTVEPLEKYLYLKDGIKTTFIAIPTRKNPSLFEPCIMDIDVSGKDYRINPETGRLEVTIQQPQPVDGNWFIEQQPQPAEEEQQPRKCVDSEKITIKSSSTRDVSVFCKYENQDGFAVPVYDESYPEMGENYRQCGNAIDVGFSSHSVLVNGSLTYYKISDFTAINQFYFDCIDGVLIKERQGNFFCSNFIRTVHTEYDLDFCNCWSDEPCAELN